MTKIKSLFAIFMLFASTISFAQYTDVVNSNRPGESMGAFSVGKTILQTEVGLYGIKEKYDPIYHANGFGTDLSLRYGFFREQLEVVTNIQYQTDKYSSTLLNDGRSGFKKLIIGAKYLIYDPFKNYKEKISLTSWKANHRFKWRQFVPAVSFYAGANLKLGNNPFSPAPDENFSPKAMLITQNQFPGSNVFIFNLYYDKITTVNPTLGYIFTYTKGFGEHWSSLLEYKGVNSKLYSDGIFTGGAAYLFDKNMQVDLSISSNYKSTPAYLYGGIGFSWRFEQNYKEVKISNIKKNKAQKDSKTEKQKKRKDQVEIPKP